LSTAVSHDQVVIPDDIVKSVIMPASYRDEAGIVHPVNPDFQMVFVPGWFWDHGFRSPNTLGMSIGLSYNGPSSGERSPCAPPTPPLPHGSSATC
jgi:hypothetical protein